MGQKGRGIVGNNVGETIDELKRAYLDELLAFSSYWMSARIMGGFFGEQVAKMFAEEAQDELGHAQKLAERILQLGGDVVVHPKDWDSGANASWVAPREDETDVEGMLRDQLDAERGAIETYNRIAQKAFGRDPVTYDLVTQILKDEVHHEELFESLLARMPK